MAHIKNRVGDVSYTRVGNYKMTIVEYRDAKDIDVQFEDGSIVTTRYNSFKIGRVRKPVNYVGQRFKNKYDIECEIISVNGTKCDIKFDDGTILKNITYSNIIKGTFKHPNIPVKRLNSDAVIHTERGVGDKSISNHGESMEVITYRGFHDIDVKFEDGTIVEHRSYDWFKKGMIKNPNRKS